MSGPRAGFKTYADFGKAASSLPQRFPASSASGACVNTR